MPEVAHVSPILQEATGTSFDNGRVLILLPPSETKTRPPVEASRTLAVESMGLPELLDARRTMLRAARRTAAGTDAAGKLQVPASAPELIARMEHLEDEPTALPLAVYSGILYDQLEAEITPDPHRQLLVQSALFGVVDAATDRIPAYRLSATSTVSRLGKVGRWWAPRLRSLGTRLLEVEAAGPSPVVVDCRSGAYRTMMPLRPDDAVHVLEVSPVQERAGARTVVSHDAKRYRGWVTRALLDAPAAPATADEVVDLLRSAFAGRLQIELDGDRLVVLDRVS